jgi:hypothetical protein
MAALFWLSSLIPLNRPLTGVDGVEFKRAAQPYAWT